MATCGYCGNGILFGGIQSQGQRFCNHTCYHNTIALMAAARVADDYVQEQVRALHQGDCPRCNDAGPVDVHRSHWVWSFGIMTSWRSRTHLCCRGCGRKEQMKGILFSSLLGWWGFPWGFIMTPTQIFRDLAGLLNPPSSNQPSPNLYRLVRVSIGDRILQARR